MAVSVLNIPRAIEVSIYVVRSYIEMRQIALKYAELADKIRQLEGIFEIRICIVFRVSYFRFIRVR